ncbi:MAG: VOC family protein [Nitrospinae bacterium]|nr:VOC family protein [Nitrospinota bacterium]
MTRITLIHHVNVQISDRQRTQEWYEKVLSVQFLDRGPALNKRQLQLRLGTGEIHFTETPQPTTVRSSHFAVEVDNWDAMLAHLKDLGIPHARTSAASTGSNIGGTDPFYGRREDSGEYYTYIHDPDGNMIELVYHPLGLEDSEGKKVGLAYDPQGLRWAQIPGFVTAS